MGHGLQIDALIIDKISTIYKRTIKKQTITEIYAWSFKKFIRIKERIARGAILSVQSYFKQSKLDCVEFFYVFQNEVKIAVCDVNVFLIASDCG